jgi:hypothetical protein
VVRPSSDWPANNANCYTLLHVMADQCVIHTLLHWDMMCFLNPL